MSIIPAIPAQSFSALTEKVGLVAGAVDRVQVDVCDGKYVDSKTWPYVTKQLTTDNRQPAGKKEEQDRDRDFQELIDEKRGLPFWNEVDYEFDLMVKEPEGVVADYVHAGASGVIIHLESTFVMGDIIREWGTVVDIGIALRPATPLSELDSYMHEVRYVQFMGSDRIGHSGLTLDPVVLDRIRVFRKKYPEHAIGVDIGVNFETAPLLISAGATHLAATSAIFNAPDPREAIVQFNKLFL